MITKTKEKTVKEKKVGLYDFIGDICFDKQYLLNKDVATEKAYNIYMVNKVLSMYYDTLMYAFYVERFWQLPKEMHYKFLMYAIPRKKRYIKYVKIDKTDDLKYITEYYNVSNQKGMEYMRLLSKDQIETIKKKYDNIKL